MALIKRVAVTTLRPGMFVERIGLPWFRHPFLTSRVGLIKDPKTVSILRSLGIKEVEIDLDRGLDEAQPATPPTPTRAPARELPVSDALRTPQGATESAPGRPGPQAGETARQTPASGARPPRRASTGEDEHAPGSEPPRCSEAAYPFRQARQFQRIPDSSDQPRTLRYARHLFAQSVDTARILLADAARGGSLDTGAARGLIGRLIDCAKSNDSVLRLLGVLKHYDEYTYTHSLNVAAMGVLFGRNLGLPDTQLEIIGLAGLLHDVGKSLLPSELVNKPGKLSDEEFAQMRRHTDLGYEFVTRQPGIPPTVAGAVLEHHERHDGSGYPRRIDGSRIGCVARILSVLDVYDALTSDRVYRPRMSPHKALRVLFEGRGASHPENLIKRFAACLGAYPPSSVVQLKNGLYAVVTGTDPAQPLRPPLMVFQDAAGRPVTRRRVETLAVGAAAANSGYAIQRAVEPDDVAPPEASSWM